MSDPYRYGNVTVIRETDKAILVHFTEDSYADDLWIPKSVIDDDSEVWNEKNGTGELIVAGWWAEKQGLR